MHESGILSCQVLRNHRHKHKNKSTGDRSKIVPASGLYLILTPSKRTWLAPGRARGPQGSRSPAPEPGSGGAESKHHADPEPTPRLAVVSRPQSHLSAHDPVLDQLRHYNYGHLPISIHLPSQHPTQPPTTRHEPRTSKDRRPVKPTSHWQQRIRWRPSSKPRTVAALVRATGLHSRRRSRTSEQFLAQESTRPQIFARRLAVILAATATVNLPTRVPFQVPPPPRKLKCQPPGGQWLRACTGSRSTNNSVCRHHRQRQPSCAARVRATVGCEAEPGRRRTCFAAASFAKRLPHDGLCGGLYADERQDDEQNWDATYKWIHVSGVRYDAAAVSAGDAKRVGHGAPAYTRDGEQKDIDIRISTEGVCPAPDAISYCKSHADIFLSYQQPRRSRLLV